MIQFSKIKKINKNINNEDIYHLSIKNNHNFFGNNILLHNCDFRSELHVILYNSGTDTFKIEQGMRIGQLVTQKIELPNWLEVEELDETIRGTGGFGSTGLK